MEQAPACEPLEVEGFERPTHSGAALRDVPIEWGERLSAFYEDLARLSRGRKKEPLRIGVHGDSNLTQDFLTGELRRALQGRYGDAGHGFLVAARAWGWYKHQDVQQDNDRWWSVLAISSPRSPDLGYGIAGIAAVCNFIGGKTWFSTAPDSSPIGQHVSRLEVFYRPQPGGGAFKVQIDGQTKDEVDANGSPEAGRRVYEVEDGPHKLEIETTKPGGVRILGVAFERDRPGVVVDSFGVGGVYFQALTLDDHALTGQMAKQRNHSLLVYWMGANPHHAREYTRDVKVLVEERRKAVPNLPVLLVSPPDAADKGMNSPSNPVSYSITQHMRRAAEANGAAFWPMRDAQGGEGAGARFLKHGLAIDKQHLSLPGSRLMAHMLLHALWADFQRYLASHPRAGCDEPK